MERKVIDLEIVDELDGSGVDAIALVDSPAIEKNFMYFKAEKFVEPESGESESDYMGRCVPVLIGEGKDQDQAVAICISTYQNMAEEKFAAECPPATQDIALNLEGRQNAIDTAHYGPLNPNEPNEEYWNAKAEMFGSTIEEAKSARCGNCVFFKTDEATLACIAKGIGNEGGDPYDVIDAGGLGYCEAFDFKCAASRTCDAWVAIKEKMEIDTTALPAYVDEVGNTKKKQVDLSAVLEFAKTVGLKAEDFLSNGLKFSEDSESIDLELAKGYTVYKYTGSVGSDTRDFCKEMVGMDLYYTFEDIDAMGSRAVNPGFGLNGDNTYSIWKYKGGPNCKHRWTKFYVNEDGGYENKGAAPGIAGEKPNDMANNGYAFAAIEDKMELVGPVAIPDIEIPRKDKQGNTYFVRFSKEVVKRMAEKFMREQKLAESNIQHDGEQDGKSYVYESYIVETEDDKANTLYGLNVPIGTWMIKMRVMDKAIWDKVKSGEVKGFSLEGSFMDREDYEQYQKDREIYNKVIRILKNS